MKKRSGSITALVLAIVVLVLLVATAYLGAAAVIERNTAQGERLLKDGQYTEAIAVFNRAEEINKYVRRDGKRIIEGLTQSSFWLEVEHYTQVVRDEPNNAEARFKLGSLYVTAKDYNKVREQIRALEEIRGREAREYASELTQAIGETSPNGIFRDFLEKLEPNLPKIPGLFDSSRDMPQKDATVDENKGDTANDEKDIKKGSGKEPGEVKREPAGDPPRFIGESI